MDFSGEQVSTDAGVLLLREVAERMGLANRLVVTNILSLRPEIIYEVVYCGRGQMENFIKELKLGLKSDRTSCYRFLANAFRLFLHSFAYSLLHPYGKILSLLYFYSFLS